MIYTKKIIYLFLGTAMSLNTVTAQILNAESKVIIILSDHSEVILYQKANAFDEAGEEYYYLPTHLRFGRSKNNDPEFSFLTYKKNKEVTGAILHFLVTWGLNKFQLDEACMKLKEMKGPEATLVGAVMPESKNYSEGFVIEGTSTLVQILNRSMTSIGTTTVMPYAKIAASFQLNKEDSETFDKAIKNYSNELDNTWVVLNYQIKFRKKGASIPFNTPYQLKQNFKELINL